MLISCNLQTLCETLLATSVSKVVAALLTYPCQNVRACQQASPGKVTVGDLVRRGGARALYRYRLETYELKLIFDLSQYVNRRKMPLLYVRLPILLGLSRYCSKSFTQWCIMS